MDTPQVQTLLGAVRRHLWLGHLHAAGRLALWGTAGWMLFAGVVHRVAWPVPVGAVLLGLAVLWTAMSARVARQRPADAACALWADRHLGGASAFTTLLELDRGNPGAASAQAVRCLEEFAALRVPQGLVLLAERPDAAHLSRPLVSASVCTALASLVLTLPPAVAPTSQGPVASVAGTVGRSAPEADSPEQSPLVGEIARALREAPSDAATARESGRGGNEPAPGAGQVDEHRASEAAADTAMPPGSKPSASGPTPGSAEDAVADAGADRLPGTGSGRDAGDSRDERADAAASRPVRGTIPVQAVDVPDQRPSAERRTDRGRTATYDEEPSTRAASVMRVDAAPAAATPPVAAADLRLTPTETLYVQAWLKASSRQR